MEPTKKTKRTEALSKAQKEYYQRNRDKRLEEMRAKARERNKMEKEACLNNPALLAERRKRFLDKYYEHVMRDTQSRIDGWITDPGISKTFKLFLKENVEPVKTALPRKFFTLLGKLAIAEKPNDKPINELIDGASDKPSIAESYASSQQCPKEF
jgi:hypothetical protein